MNLDKQRIKILREQRDVATAQRNELLATLKTIKQQCKVNPEAKLGGSAVQGLARIAIAKIEARTKKDGASQ